MQEEPKLWSDDWFAHKLSEVQAKFDLQRDAQLAKFFNVSPVAISRIKKGDLKMPVAMKISILDRLGFLATRDGIAAAIGLVSPSVGERMLQNLNDLVKNNLHEEK